MERRRHSRYLPVASLAAVAIAGLLFMHALDPAALRSDQASGHGAHGSNSMAGLHVALGICVFVLGGLGLTLPASTPRQRGPRPLTMRPAYRGVDFLPVADSGRQRLANLCVLRL